MTSGLESRAVSLIGRLGAEGYSRDDFDGVSMLLRQTGSAITPRNTLVGIGWDPGTATAASFEAQNEAMNTWYVELCYRNPKQKLAAIDMFSILFAETAEPSAIEAARGLCPKRYFLTARALVHGPEEAVELFEGRRIWGFAVIKRHRQQLRDFLSEE